MRDQKPTLLTKRFQEALVYTAQLHAHQVRKGNNTPYIAHLLSVSSLVLEAGGDEDQAIAALLHDAVEDQGGQQTLDEIRARFGDRVADIVDSCSDAYVIPKPPWRQRKDDYVAHLPEASSDARLVSLADKLHNARSILRDLQLEGNQVWEKFNGGRDGTLWYYQKLATIFSDTDRGFLVDEFNSVVAKIKQIADLDNKEL
ncbi:MAG: HD domain-containing protein [Chloroflexi bacterium]|nr:HD domain-containing protein [Chloroflexota bacterium]